MDLNTKILGIAFLLNTGLGVSTFIYTERNLAHRYYLWLIFSVSVWILTNFLVPFAYSYEIGFTIAALGYVSALSIAYSFFNFCNYFPLQIKSTQRIKISNLSWVIFIILSVVTFIPGIVIKDITLNPWSIVPGISVAFIFLYFLILLASSFLILLKTLRNPIIQRIEKMQTWLVFIGYLSAALFGTIFNLVLPFLYQNYDFVRIGPVFVLVAIFFISYSIIKHHLFNIEVIAAELFTFGVWVGVISQAIMADTFNGRIIGGITSVFAITIGILLIKYVKKVVALTEDLGIANEKLKGLDKLKSEFLSLASHQLRSPLTAIKGYTSMLVEGSYGKLAEKQKEIVGHVLESTQSMISMVEDFLNVSKIEQGGMQYVFAPTSLAKLVSDLFAEMKITAQNKGLDFTLTMDTGDAFTIDADAGKLRQVFLNLIDNSIKYTPNGFVHISLARDADNKTITFSVKDSGAGVSAEEKEKLFEKFKRGDGSKLNAGGSGLGLYLAREIVTAHHGRILVESEGKGKGSCFAVELGVGR